VLCPFHGKRIGLGSGARLSVREHETVQLGDAVFVRLSDEPDHDRGFRKAAVELAGRRIAAALTTTVRANASLIIENAFDAEHFPAVHEVPQVNGMDARQGPDGELVIEGEFVSRTPTWENTKGAAPVGEFRNRFLARAFSPGLVITELGPPGHGHIVITGANPTAEGCTARVAVSTREGDEAALGALIAGSRRAFDQDRDIWENLDPTVTPRLDPRDAPVVAFQTFCAGFPEA
jgi:hypothetical protein